MLKVTSEQSAGLYVARLEHLEAHITGRLSAIDKAGVAFPAVGVALIGVTGSGGNSAEIDQVVHTSLVLLAAGLVFYAVFQMRAIFVYAGHRKAIEEYTESEGLLPYGLFTWEGGPALEISGARRLDDKINLVRFIPPIFLLVLDLGMCGYALLKLQTFGVVTVWFICSSLIFIISLVAMVAAFYVIPATLDRVYCWTLDELRKNVVPAKP
jgi:hypothetical protein